jgi:hypothetical protein
VKPVPERVDTPALRKRDAKGRGKLSDEMKAEEPKVDIK